MAKLVHGYAPGHWTNTLPDSENRCIEVGPEGKPYLSQAAHQCSDRQEHSDRERKSLEDLGDERLWKTPAGDSYAFYYIFSEKPLQLIHLPVGDGYLALPATIRGLRLGEVKREVEWNKHLRRLFRERDGASGA